MKSQAVIPREVRQELGLKPGDTITFRRLGEHIVVEKGESSKVEDPFATFNEWASPEDDEAYADL
jgi:antitoxin PrlF